jgi:hypothetical protein
LAEKEAIINLHWDLNTYDEADYYELNDILSAKKPEEREVDPLSLIH